MDQQQTNIWVIAKQINGKNFYFEAVDNIKKQVKWRSYKKQAKIFSHPQLAADFVTEHLNKCRNSVFLVYGPKQ